MTRQTKRSLSLYAFEISPEDLPQYPLYVMQFPKEWIDFLLIISENYKLSFYLKDLRVKLQSLFPQILCGYDNPLTRQMPGPWLVAVEAVSPEWIRRFAYSWLKEQLIKKNLMEKANSIPEVEFKWSAYNIPKAWDDQIRYHLIPGLFAYDLCSKPREVSFEGHHLNLNFVHVFYGKNHECMTLPSTDEEKAYAYVIRFSVITRGGQSKRIILRVHIGSRRFILDPIESPLNEAKALRAKAKATLLLAIRNPFVNVKPERVVSLSRVQFKKGWNGHSAYVDWTSSVQTLFLDVFNKELKVEDFLTDPKRYTQEGEPIQGFLVYNNKSYCQEPYVKAGLGLPERIELLELVKKVWNLERVQLANIPEVNVRGRAKLERFPVQYPKKMNITVEFWMQEEMFRSCIDTLTKPFSGYPALLIVSEKENEYILNCSQEVIIHINQRDNSFLVQELEQEGLREKRIKEITNIIEKARPNSITLAMVEIGEKRLYKTRHDPKDAVRLGMSKTGRLSQFIYSLHKIKRNLAELTTKDKNRIINSFLDLLADAGFYRANVAQLLKDENLVAVGILQKKVKYKGAKFSKTEYLPVLLWFNGSEILAKRKGDTQWMTFRESLLDYSRVIPFVRGSSEEKEQFQNWLEQEIETLLLNNRNTAVYLLVDAGLRVKWWGGLKNDEIRAKSLPLSKRLFQDSRLRIIRLNHTEDIPQYDILKKAKNGRLNRDKGLFRDGELYYSVGSRPDTMQEALRITKYDKPDRLLLKQQAVEIFPSGVKDPEDADELGILTHLLREANLTFKYSTAQPFPLHMLQSIEKYWKIQANSLEDSGYNGEFDDYDLAPGEFDDRIIRSLRRRYGYGSLKSFGFRSKY